MQERIPYSFYLLRTFDCFFCPSTLAEAMPGKGENGNLSPEPSPTLLSFKVLFRVQNYGFRLSIKWLIDAVLPLLRQQSRAGVANGEIGV